MLVQQYLRSGKSLEDLNKELAISASLHPNLSLCILNYSQIESPKTNNIVQECRSLILELNSWNVVSRAFFRFYNLGESLEITEKFDWTNYRAYSKEDGSLTHLFQYQNNWHMATRSTFGNLPMGEASFTWSELFWSILDKNKVRCLDPTQSYIFELCSLYNQVVTIHPEPKLVLLDINDKSKKPFICSCIDSHNKYLDSVAKTINVSRPEYYKFDTNNGHQVKEFVNKFSNQNEGTVVQDHTGMRLKIKNLSWLALSHLTNNGNFYYKDLYDLVIKGEADEVKANWPFSKQKCETLEALIVDTKENLNKVWAEIRDIPVQKDFALALQSRKPPLGWVLFECRRHNISVADVFSLPHYYEKVKKGILELIA